MINFLKRNLKNSIGWKTNRKIVVFSVDDYGNVRLASEEARKKIDQSGFKASGWFDKFDSLENREDLEMLFDVLTSVKDVNGKHAVFTPFAVPCNINFEQMEAEDYSRYVYELLPQTFAKLEAYDESAYKGTWNLWKEGIQKGLMNPQFHGREHFNLKVFEDKLARRDKELLVVLKNRSYTGLSTPGYKNIGQTSAFGFWDFSENKEFETIIIDGLDAFEKVFGYRSIHFNAPAGNEHSIIYQYLSDNGVKYIDIPLIKREHQGGGKYKTRINYTGKKYQNKLLYLVRNVVFEPSENTGTDWLNFAMRQVDTAFKWNKPAIISSHRVNFCGHIDPDNRKNGLQVLSQLLKKMIKKWPDIEFMSANQLGDLIANNK